MKNWIKWGLAGAMIGIVIEFLTLGYLHFFWLEPKLERAIGPLIRPIFGTTAFPGETLILTLLLYFITGAVIGYVVYKYILHRD